MNLLRRLYRKLFGERPEAEAARVLRPYSDDTEPFYGTPRPGHGPQDPIESTAPAPTQDTTKKQDPIS